MIHTSLLTWILVYIYIISSLHIVDFSGLSNGVMRFGV